MIIIEIFKLWGRILIENSEANQSIQATGEEAEKSGGKIDKLGGFAKGLGGILGGALVAGVGAAVGGLAALGNVASDMQNALGNLQAKTGVSDDEMKNLEKTLGNIYAAGYGESFDDISEAMATVKQNTGATGEELEKITKAALGLSETFDMDVNESTRAAEQMTKQFGITSEQAFNLIVQGAQKGANKNGDLLDTLNEYGPQFAEIGLDAEYFTDILINGAENGAFSIDKVGDAVKEMNIRMKEGNDKTKEALQSLGFNADEMTKAFANGGEEGADAFNELMIALANTEDPIEKNKLGIAIMGTAYEDLGAQAIDSLAEVGNHVDMNADSLGKLNEIKYDTLGEALTGIGRSALMGIMEPFNEHVMPIINDFASLIAEKMPNVQATMSNMFGAIFEAAGNVFGFFSANILPIFQEYYGYVSSYFPIIKQVAQDVFNGIVEVLTTVWNFVSANILPIFKDLFGWVMSNMPTIQSTFQTVFDKIKVVIGFVWNIIKDNLLPILSKFFGWVSEKIPVAKSIFEGAFGIIKNVVSAVWDIFENFLLPIIKGVVDYISKFIPPIQAIVEGVFDGIFWAVDKVVGVFNKVSDAIAKAIDWISFWDDTEPKEKTLKVNEVRTTSTFDKPTTYAVGTNYHRGGLAIVGEKGPELVELPSGSKVKTANQTSEILERTSKFSNTFNIYTHDDPSKVVAKEMRKLAIEFD